MNSWKEFLNETYKYSNELNKYVDNLIFVTPLKNSECVIDAGCGLGLLSLRILLKNKNVKVIAIDNDENCIEEIKKIKNDNLFIMDCNLEKIKLKNNSVDKIFSRASLMHCADKFKVLSEYYRVLKPNSSISLFEVVFYDKLDRYYKYLSLKNENYSFYKTVESKVRNDLSDCLTNYDADLLKRCLDNIGFKNICIIEIPEVEYFSVDEESFDSSIFYFDKPHNIPLKEKFMKYMTPGQFDMYYDTLKQSMINKTLSHEIISLYIFAQKDPDFLSALKLKIKIALFVLLKIVPLKLKYAIIYPLEKLKCNIECLLKRLCRRS